MNGSTNFIRRESGTEKDEDEDGNDGDASDEQIHATLKGLKKVNVQLDPEHWEMEDMAIGTKGSMALVDNYAAPIEMYAYLSYHRTWS